MADVVVAGLQINRTKLVAGLGAGLAAFLAILSARRTAAAVRAAVASGGKFRVHATGYWPFSAKESEQTMEGGVHDRKGRPLHTVEDFFEGRSDHASVSGDDAIFPYGQKIIVDWFGKTLVGRVTDTGGHFRGLGKVRRVWNEEPLDFCVASKQTPVPKSGVIAQAVPGDNFAGGKAVAWGKLKDQIVVGVDTVSDSAYLRGVLAGLSI